jgi:hypothetical protein
MEDKGFKLTPTEEIRARVKALQGRMEEKGLDLVLILQNVGLFYFAGTVQPGYLCVPHEENSNSKTLHPSF